MVCLSSWLGALLSRKLVLCAQSRLHHLCEAPRNQTKSPIAFVVFLLIAVSRMQLLQYLLVVFAFNL